MKHRKNTILKREMSEHNKILINVNHAQVAISTLNWMDAQRFNQPTNQPSNQLKRRLKGNLQYWNTFDWFHGMARLASAPGLE